MNPGQLNQDMMINKRNPIVAFITDFGKRDSYVAEMHAILLEVCPEVKILDITHNIAPGDIKSAAYMVGRMKYRLPIGCALVAVVDPGVGTSRQAVAIKTGERYFIGPDNGVFSRLIMGSKNFKVRILDQRDLMLSEYSNTFHGRDLFTPVAGKLISGVRFESIGREGSLIDTFPAKQPLRNRDNWAGEVIYIDHFGNIITDINHCLQGKIEVGGFKDILKAENYHDQPRGEVFWLNGSGGTIEISMNGESAANHLGLEIGDPICLFDNI